ncbi:ArsR/SmtB family transcription factor [Roseospira goensis]|uniref:DNA-binding transcriptional ArsR family regulator n=1 Tax=Roseospira goensis TaxID=391922 RepID=A0A7W6RXX4_9PROT|nr:metalloregulator ArsR/SmtB family transcription factor [Roseospira goensis]MBB4285248.1 DNA-binding transcriptional ArsR family regulator [Roseospira goensis]
MDVERLHAHTARAAALLKALGNDRRLLILCTLVGGEKTVGELEAKVGLGQSALSQHLARLRRDGLVATRRAAQHIHYRLASAEVVAIIETLAALYCPAPAAAPPPDEEDSSHVH